ncbi:MAG: hypothetical protein LC772_10725, partial [Chloroflexi bacterium]|nr:hypothetical protein [Chloroflexota bacterium]
VRTAGALKENGMRITGVNGDSGKSFRFAALASAGMLLARLPAVGAGGGRSRGAVPPPGEVRLEGSVQTTTATRRLIMTVTDVTMSNGEQAHLAPGRTKQVILKESTIPHLRGNPRARIKLNDLANGMKAVVVAADTGVGKDTTAHDVSIWTGFRHGTYQFQKPID